MCTELKDFPIDVMENIVIDSLTNYQLIDELRQRYKCDSYQFDRSQEIKVLQELLNDLNKE